MELLHGSPEDMTGRQEREIRTYAFLDELGIQFDRTDHPDEPATSMEVCERIDAILDVRICKNLFLCNRQKTNFYLLIMPGDKPFKTKELSGQLGISRLSFGDEEFMVQFLDLYPGSVSVLGLMNDTEHQVRFLMEKEVDESEYLSCHPCLCTSSLKIKTADILQKFLPSTGHDVTVVDLTYTEEA